MPDDAPVNRPEPETEATRPPREPLHELTLGRSKPTAEPSRRIEGSAQAATDALDIASLTASCRAKSEAARWAAESQRRIREGYGWTDEDVPGDPTIVAWAERLTDAFYWANATDSAEPPDIGLLDRLGGCFETVAEALAFVLEEQDRGRSLERAIKLLAEAQSSLRRALRDLRTPDDADQLAVYEWLRATAARHRIFLKRFMRADDLANPDAWAGLLSRIEIAAGNHPQTDRQRALLENLGAHVSRITHQGKGTSLEWQAVIGSVQDVIDAGVAPSNRELRSLLLPIIDEFPDQADLPRGFRLVVRELDRYLATRHAPPTGAHEQARADMVQQAARLLAGRSVALIGGVRRPDAQSMLRTSLGLNDLVWIETKEHQSIRRFESAIARADVALVLLAIRWSSHAFGDVKQFCEQYGKPLVRLPGGYSPNQVAAQIVAQAGEQLGGEASRDEFLDRSSPASAS
jgi:hypothetical protein